MKLLQLGEKSGLYRGFTFSHSLGRTETNSLSLNMSAIEKSIVFLRSSVFVGYVLRVQPIDATHALNLSAGVSYSNVFLGRSFKRRATAFSLA